MAYTVPVLDCTPERVACYFVDPLDLSNDDPLTNPLTAANLPRVLWHSDFDYYEVFLDETVSVTFPERLIGAAGTGSVSLTIELGGNPTTVSTQYVDHAPFSAFSFAAPPFAALVVDGLFSPGYVSYTTPFVGDDNGGGTRVLAAQVTSTGISIREHWYNYTSFVSPFPSTSCPAQTMTIRAVVFAPREPASGGDMMDLDGSTQRLRLGRALLDTNNTKGFLRESATSTGLAFTVDRTLDSVPGALKRWNLDGTTTTLIGTYTGSYAGPTIRHVTV
jgi:hypothetical protein